MNLTKAESLNAHISTRIREIIDSDRFIEDSIILNEYANSLNGSVVLPKAILFPVSKQEIIQILKICKEEKLEIYPISRGKNWGYGSAQGTKQGQLILDLSKMNKVLEVDSILCSMTLQPGVSQKEAYDFLQSKADYKNLQLDVTGAGTEASVVGNILERGFGHTDYGNRFDRIITMEVVLGNGTIIKTGFGAFENTNSEKTFKYGIGPCLEGLFSQSNFGIVTEMTIELMPKPEKFGLFVCSAKNEEDLGGLVEALRILRLETTINSTVHAANKNRAIGEKENSLVKTWTMAGSISGSRYLVKARKKRVKQVFKNKVPNCKVFFISDDLMKWVGILNNYKKIAAYIDLKYLVDIQKGIPTNVPLGIMINRKLGKNEPLKTNEFPLNFKWIPAVCRADEESAMKVISLMKTRFSEFGYEFRVTLTSINPRSLTFISNISFEKKTEEITKANSFYLALMEDLYSNGFLPYRSGPGMFNVFKYRDKNVTDVLKDLKSLFDPDNVIAPGKYGI